MIKGMWSYIVAIVGGLASILAAWVFGRSGGVQAEKRKLEKAYRKTRGRIDEEDYYSNDPISDVRDRMHKRGKR